MYRKGTINDCAAVYELICGLEGRRFPFDRFSRIYENQAANENYYCLVCEYEGRVVGVLNMRFEEQLHHCQRIAEIMEFVIDPSCRGRGIGKGMFSAACGLASGMDCARIELASNRLREGAHRFYLREGMRNSHFTFTMDLAGADASGNVPQA